MRTLHDSIVWKVFVLLVFLTHVIASLYCTTNALNRYSLKHMYLGDSEVRTVAGKLEAKFYNDAYTGKR